STGTLLAALALAGCAEAAGDATGIREATGDVSEHGGARRVDGDQQQALEEAISESEAKNVILLIGDGMGDSDITVARNYAEGAGGPSRGRDALPVTGQSPDYALHDDADPCDVADSPEAGTAWATGTMTTYSAIAVDSHGAPQPTLLELAKGNGLDTG